MQNGIAKLVLQLQGLFYSSVIFDKLRCLAGFTQYLYYVQLDSSYRNIKIDLQILAPGSRQMLGSVVQLRRGVSSEDGKA